MSFVKKDVLFYPLKKDDGCILYAPLTQGDLSDHIYGLQPTIESGCTATWDSTKAAYSLYSSAVWKAALQYSHPSLTKEDVVNNGITLSVYMTMDSYSGNGYSSFISLNGTKNSSAGVIYTYTCKARFSGVTFTNWHRITSVWQNGVLSHYCDGELYLQHSWCSEYATLGFPQPALFTVCELHTNNYNMTMHAKNLVVYNKALTASEVQALGDLDI